MRAPAQAMTRSKPWLPMNMFIRPAPIKTNNPMHNLRIGREGIN